MHEPRPRHRRAKVGKKKREYAHSVRVHGVLCGNVLLPDQPVAFFGPTAGGTKRETSRNAYSIHVRLEILSALRQPGEQTNVRSKGAPFVFFFAFPAPCWFCRRRGEEKKSSPPPPRLRPCRNKWTLFLALFLFSLRLRLVPLSAKASLYQRSNDRVGSFFFFSTVCGVCMRRAFRIVADAKRPICCTRSFHPHSTATHRQHFRWARCHAKRENLDKGISFLLHAQQARSKRNVEPKEEREKKKGGAGRPGRAPQKTLFFPHLPTQVVVCFFCLS